MIYANIASIPEREEFLKKTVDSLYNQVYFINLYLNNYTHNPFEKDPKINVVFGDNSKGDAGKFFFVNKCDGYYFTMDDDLIYHPNYIQNTIDNYNGGVVTYHGRSFDKFPIQSYYKSATKKLRCLDNQEHDEIVQVGGTGVMMFDTRKLNLPFEMFIYPNMADVFIAVFCKANNIEIKCLKHKKGFISYQNVGENTIFANEVRNDSRQTAIINNFFK